MELIICIVLLIIGTFEKEVAWFIAAGLFSIAGNIDIYGNYILRKGIANEDRR